MKKIISILIILLIVSCEIDIPVQTKPFIIVGKSIPDAGFKSKVPEFVFYTYQDSNKNNFSFQDRFDLYQIGDTIK